VSYGKGDAVRLKRSDPRVKALLDRFNPSDDGALITYTNRLRAEVNMAYHGEGPVRPGDRVVALGGRPYAADRVDMTEDGTSFRLRAESIKVHNGMTGTVMWAKERGIMTEMVVKLDRHRLATEDDPVIVYAGACPSAQFGAPTELPFNSPMRPKGSNLWDYAYALTAHKAQGSEFPKVIVVDQRPQNYAQWMYTALTRAKEAVVVIDWAR
jgi:ATP-dependent exoDNAse (exonuclease V) alpha subunit